MARWMAETNLPRLPLIGVRRHGRVRRNARRRAIDRDGTEKQAEKQQARQHHPPAIIGASQRIPRQVHA